MGRGKRSAAEPAPPYLTSRTTLLFTCTSCPRWWPSTCSLVGSSLEPAAGSTSPSASTRPREDGVWSLLGELCLVCVLCVCCVCVCVCLCVFVCGCICVCSCVFVCVSLFYWVCFWLFVSSCACCWLLWVSLWHLARPCGVSLALWVALGLHCDTLGFHFDTPEI